MSAAKKVLDYMDIESEMHDAVNMLEVACQMVEAAQNEHNHTARGYSLSDGEMHLISFTVYHATSLALALKAKWSAIHESNGGGEAGGGS